MIYNYVPGDFELLSLQSIGSVGVPPEVIKIENWFTNIFADLHIYTDSGGTAEVPGSAIDLLGLDEYVTGKEETESGKTAYKAFQITNATYQGVPLWVTFNNFGTYTDNQAIVDYMTASRDIYNPRRFTSGRIDSQEIPVTGFNVPLDAWYKIAEVEAGGEQLATADISVMCSNSSGANAISCNVGATSTGGNANDFIELYPLTGINGAYQATSMRHGYSVGPGTGATCEAFLKSGTYSMVISIGKNKGRSAKGWELLPNPVLSDGLLPDGGTPATFIEAGAELSFVPAGSGMFQSVIGYKVSNDTIRCVAQWEDIPKQGSGLTITLPSTSLSFRDGAGNQAPVTVAHTTSSFNINGEAIVFYINEVGAFTALNTGPCFPIFSGSGGKLTITG